MVMESLSPEELLVQRKEQLFSADIEESKTRQQRVIAQCNNEIEYFQTQIGKLEQQKQDAQDLLDELESRFPAEIVEE